MLRNLGNGPLWNHNDTIGGGILLGSWLPSFSCSSLLKLLGFSASGALIIKDIVMMLWLLLYSWLHVLYIYMYILTFKFFWSHLVHGLSLVLIFEKVSFLFFFFFCTCLCLNLSYFQWGVFFYLFYFLFCFSFGSPCRTPVLLPLLVGCLSLCLRSPGSRRVQPTKQENSKNSRTLRGSSDR